MFFLSYFPRHRFLNLWIFPHFSLCPPRLLFLKTYIIPLLSHHTSSLFVRSVLLFRFLAHKQVSYEQLFTFFELNMADGRLRGNCWALLSCISLAAQEFNISYAHRGTKLICFTTEQLHRNKQQQVPLRYAPPLNLILLFFLALPPFCLPTYSSLQGICFPSLHLFIWFSLFNLLHYLKHFLKFVIKLFLLFSRLFFTWGMFLLQPGIVAAQTQRWATQGYPSPSPRRGPVNHFLTKYQQSGSGARHTLRLLLSKEWFLLRVSWIISTRFFCVAFAWFWGNHLCFSFF